MRKMNKEKIKEKVLKEWYDIPTNKRWTGIRKVIDLTIEKTAKAIFEEIELAGGKGRKFLPKIDGFVINLKDWKELKKKWLR